MKGFFLVMKLTRGGGGLLQTGLPRLVVKHPGPRDRISWLPVTCYSQRLPPLHHQLCIGWFRRLAEKLGAKPGASSEEILELLQGVPAIALQVL